MMKEVDGFGYIRYHNSDGRHHREDGPAIIWPDGSTFWWLHGHLHREDGPAIIWPDGTEEWFLKGTKHKFEDYVNKIYPNDCPEKTMFLLKWG